MRTRAIFKRILLQRRSDKRSLVLLFVAPLVILSLLYLLLQIPSGQTYRIGLVSEPGSTSLTTALKSSEELKLVKVKNSSRQTMNSKNLTAILDIRDKAVHLTFSNKDTGSTQHVGSIITALLQKTQAEAAQSKVQQSIKSTLSKALQSDSSLAGKFASLDISSGSSLRIKTRYLYGNSKLSPFDNLAPVLVSFFVFFFVFLISGISLVNERSSGTLVRMLISPVRRSEIISGYTLAYGLLAVAQTILIVLWARFVLQMNVLGNFAWVIVINLLIALIALLIGLLLSALAKSEFQFIQFVPIAIVPQFLFSGIISIDTMSRPLQWLAHIMPLYYGVDALQKVIKQGLGLASIRLDLTVLLAIVILLYLLNIAALRNLRRI
ncbi:ABC transporter permease [Lactovum odontotermitis]